MNARFVYVMSRPGGQHKIGTSTDPSRRRHNLGSRVKLEHVVERTDASAVERLAHKLLKEHRLDGEWFSVNARVAIAAITRAAELADAGELSLSEALTSAQRQARRRAQFNRMRRALKAIAGATSLKQAKSLADEALA